MEHQSAIAYGNDFKPGYKNSDLSGTGIGMGWDFIVVHESGHEWWGNSVSASNKADMWIHEAFTSYAEVLYTECKSDNESAYQYARGVWQNIKNDRPVQGNIESGLEGSGDMYFKGSAMIHMIRVMMDDDPRFFDMLRDITTKYRWQQVDGKTIEAEILSWTNLPLEGFLDVYLRTTNIPELKFYRADEKLLYKISGVDEDFYLKYLLWLDGKPKFVELRGNSGYLIIPEEVEIIESDKNYLIKTSFAQFE